MRISLIVFLLQWINGTADLNCFRWNSNEITCSNMNSTEDADGTPRQCFDCQIYSLPNSSSTLFDQCQNKYRCVHFNFADFSIFETFFHHFHDQVTNIFHPSSDGQRSNNLNIRIARDNLKEIVLSDFYSIVHFNRTFYPDFYLILVQNRFSININLDRNLSDVSLRGLSISVKCNETSEIHLMIVDDFNSTNRWENCALLYRNPHQIRYTTTESMQKEVKSKKRWILLFIGALVFCLWFGCLTYLFFIRTRRWRNQADPNQRTSIVSSVFSNDSFESHKDEILPIEEKLDVEQSSLRGLYAFDREF